MINTKKKCVLFFSMLFLLLFTSNRCFAYRNPSRELFYEKLTKESQLLYKKAFGNKPVIIEFFSFLCPHCYEFYRNIDKKIFKNKIPKNVKIIRIHYSKMGQENGFATLLGYTWVVAKMLNVENKIIGPIFDGIHNTETIHDYKSIKKLFIKITGITSNTFDAAWNSNIAKTLFEKEYDLVEKLDINLVPDIYINNKYVINLSSLYNNYGDNLYSHYINLVLKLLKK
ncbi:thioredoxin domain-containing protein [Enterobacteriaceae endosymbiont of Donacia proxima]|uniref:thioredoxin domain-containing protein n=1 Tax=Enterobacteriaceae endosymbiont of Donacia proxima TaxID=2675782 RepID=UPI001448AA4B|nr:thioredoxin domain-containing protein [Enterobacteriaceae endosymbiont of Donacia proxima]QJC35440.1 thioredoxin domain-containing protein [Enterobacteriaceae endosymbiont of Donacia proxima]